MQGNILFNAGDIEKDNSTAVLFHDMVGEVVSKEGLSGPLARYTRSCTRNKINSPRFCIIH